SSQPRGHRAASTPQPVATATARSTARVAATGTAPPAGAKTRRAGTTATAVRTPLSSTWTARCPLIAALPAPSGCCGWCPASRRRPGVPSSQLSQHHLVPGLRGLRGGAGGDLHHPGAPVAGRLAPMIGGVVGIVAGTVVGAQYG